MWVKKCLLFSLLLPAISLAMPKKYEIWFISIDKNENIKTSLNQSIHFSHMLALGCQEMGEYCFDPQVGLYKPDGKGGILKEIDSSAITTKDNLKQLESARSLDRDMINCEKNYEFDIFCGKAQKVTKKKTPKVELWIDISSSMKQVDFKGFEEQCYRESFAKLVDNKCGFGDKLEIKMFNESKKQMGTFHDLCTNYGLNNTKRLIEQLEEIDSEYAIIITDIFEASEDVIHLVESSNARGSIRGLEKPLYAKDLKGLVKEVTSYCR